MRGDHQSQITQEVQRPVDRGAMNRGCLAVDLSKDLFRRNMAMETAHRIQDQLPLGGDSQPFPVKQIAVVEDSIVHAYPRN